MYVRSFADSNGDGMGDLGGVLDRLPYLRDLGVDALWFSPWYPSPLADSGYDVADYRAIDPAFGTLEQAEQLIAEARALGIRTIIDVVPNHVSMLPADQFGDRVNLVGGKRHDRGASRLPGDLAVAGEFKLRQPRPGHDRGAGQQPLDHRAHGGGAQQQRLVAAAPVQDAIGEDMPAFQIGRDLDFVDGEKRDVEIPGHRLDSGDPEPRLWRLDLFFARNQRDRILARARGDLVVDLARQQPQRQADHAGGMREHPLDREMGLAGIGGAEHRGDTGAGSPSIAGR